jgi:hypothetical protein
MMYGLIEGPHVNVRRCDDILKRGERNGVHPSRPAGDIAIDLVKAYNQEKATVKP